MLSETSIGLEWGLLPAVLLEHAPTTLPATLLVLAATAVNLGAGSIAVRALAGRPYRTVAEAVLGGMTGAVLIDAALMMALGAVDAFRWPVVGLILGAILLAPIAWPLALRPVLRRRHRSSHTGTYIAFGMRGPPATRSVAPQGAIANSSYPPAEMTTSKELRKASMFTPIVSRSTGPTTT